MKYAIFDLDGTILNSMIYWRGFAKRYIIENNLDPKGEFNDFTGANWSDRLCEYVNETYGTKITRQEIYAWGINFIMGKYGNEAEMKPGAQELLDNLKAQGVKMCLCSSTDRYMMEPAIERFHLDDYFEFTMHCREYGKEKSEPDIYLECMHRLGCENPSETAIFEDAFYAASTAKNAGFYVVGMYDASEKRTELVKELADQYVTDYSQLDYSKLPD